MHRSQLTDSRPFRFKECEKTNKTVQSYKKQKLMHKGLCSTCGKIFPWKNSLTIHMRVCSGGRPFTKLCGKSFANSSDLGAHSDKCSECPASFASFRVLSMHRLQHAGCLDARSLRKHSKQITYTKNTNTRIDIFCKYLWISRI